MANTATTDRTATRAEVLAVREQLRRLAAKQRLTELRVDVAGTVIVHSDAPGYGPLRLFAREASQLIGVWVNVITDDVPAAQVHADTL